MGDETDFPGDRPRGRHRGQGGAAALPHDELDHSAPRGGVDPDLRSRPADDDGAPREWQGDADGRSRRRRRRRRRTGVAPPPAGEASAAPAQESPAERPRDGQAPRDAQTPRGARWGDGDEGAGRRRRRRRRRREPDGNAVAAEPVRERPARAEPPRERAGGQRNDVPPQRFDGDDAGDASGRRSRRRRRRTGGGGGGDRFESFEPRESRSDRGGDRGVANLLPDRDPFVDLVSIDPDERIELEIDPEDIEMRVIDIVTPIGKGQRALIVAPPKTGKTTILMQLARAISENHPEVELIVMLVDERPEEVTAFKRAGYGTVLASSNDEPTRRHLALTQHVGELARRLVVEGKDVCVLLDSITRMARAHNVASGGGRTMSGGLDTRALERPKRFFGAARNISGGGSLTILATALIDTGSRMDEIIFQEFKGTGNCEIQLDRRIAERRIWPAIDIMRSGTRKEEKLFPRDEYDGVVALRRALSGKPPAEAMTMLLNRLKEYRTNREFLLEVARKAQNAV